MPRSRERLEVGEDGVAALRVDADGGLVEDQHVGIVDERGGDVEAPLHSAAERLRLVAGAVGEADERERRVDALAQQRAGHPVERAEQLEVGGGAEVLVDRELLRNDADAPLGEVGVLVEGQTRRVGADEDRAAIGADQAAQHRDGRRLAGAVRAEQADDLAGADRQRQVGDDGAAAVRLAKASGFEHGCLRFRTSATLASVVRAGANKRPIDSSAARIAAARSANEQRAPRHGKRRQTRRSAPRGHALAKRSFAASVVRLAVRRIRLPPRRRNFRPSPAETPPS